MWSNINALCLHNINWTKVPFHSSPTNVTTEIEIGISWNDLLEWVTTEKRFYFKIIPSHQKFPGLRDQRILKIVQLTWQLRDSSRVPSARASVEIIKIKITAVIRQKEVIWHLLVCCVSSLSGTRHIRNEPHVTVIWESSSRRIGTNRRCVDCFPGRVNPSTSLWDESWKTRIQALPKYLSEHSWQKN